MHLMRAQFSWCPKKLKINRIIPYIRFIRLALIDSKIGEIWWNYVVNNSIITKNCQSRSVIRNCLIPSKNVWLLLSTCQEVLSSHEVLIIMSDFLEFVYHIFFLNKHTPGAHYSLGLDSIVKPNRHHKFVCQ